MLIFTNFWKTTKNIKKYTRNFKIGSCHSVNHNYSLHKKWKRLNYISGLDSVYTNPTIFKFKSSKLINEKIKVPFIIFFNTFWLFESKEHSIHYICAKYLSILLKNSLETKIRKNVPI